MVIAVKVATLFLFFLMGRNFFATFPCLIFKKFSCFGYILKHEAIISTSSCDRRML